MVSNKKQQNSTGRSRGRPSRIGTDKILKNALRLFARHGYAETSFQMIADHCGASQSAILHHYPTKLALIEAVFMQVLAHNVSIISGSFKLEDNALTRLRKHFVGTLNWAMNYRDESGIILLIYYLAAYEKDFTVLYQRILQGARLKIAEILAAGKREKLFFFDEPVESITQTMHDALLGGVLNVMVSGGGKKDAEALVKRWEALFRKMLMQ